MEPIIVIALGIMSMVGQLHNYGIDTEKNPHLRNIRVRRQIEPYDMLNKDYIKDKLTDEIGNKRTHFEPYTVDNKDQNIQKSDGQPEEPLLKTGLKDAIEKKNEPFAIRNKDQNRNENNEQPEEMRKKRDAHTFINADTRNRDQENGYKNIDGYVNGMLNNVNKLTNGLLKHEINDFRTDFVNDNEPKINLQHENRKNPTVNVASTSTGFIKKPIQDPRYPDGNVYTKNDESVYTYRGKNLQETSFVNTNINVIQPKRNRTVVSKSSPGLNVTIISDVPVDNGYDSDTNNFVNGKRFTTPKSVNVYGNTDANNNDNVYFGGVTLQNRRTTSKPLLTNNGNDQRSGNGYFTNGFRSSTIRNYPTTAREHLNKNNGYDLSRTNSGSTNNGYGYGSSKNGYGVSGTGYDSSRSGYGGSGTGYDSSRSGYGGSGTGYESSRRGYGVSGTGYDSSKSGYGRSGTGYDDTSRSGYGRSGTNYDSPRSGYGVSDNGYDSKNTGYGSSIKGYGTSRTDSGSHNNGYSSSNDNGYSASNTNHRASNGHYGSTNGYGSSYDGYGSSNTRNSNPKDSYGSSNGYRSSNNGYESSRNYGATNNGYHSSNNGNELSRNGYGSTNTGYGSTDTGYVSSRNGYASSTTAYGYNRGIKQTTPKYSYSDYSYGYSVLPLPTLPSLTDHYYLNRKKRSYNNAYQKMTQQLAAANNKLNSVNSAYGTNYYNPYSKYVQNNGYNSNGYNNNGSNNNGYNNNGSNNNGYNNNGYNNNGYNNNGSNNNGYNNNGYNNNGSNNNGYNNNGYNNNGYTNGYNNNGYTTPYGHSEISSTEAYNNLNNQHKIISENNTQINNSIYNGNNSVYGDIFNEIKNVNSKNSSGNVTSNSSDTKIVTTTPRINAAQVVITLRCPQFMKYISIMGRKLCVPKDSDETKEDSNEDYF